MKKIITFLAFSIGMISFAQSINIGKFDVTMTNSKGQSLSNEENGVKVTYTPSEYFWKVEIENSSTENIEIDWDKSTFNYQKRVSKIVFNNTTRLLANQPKGKEIIPKGMILKKEIYPLEYVSVMAPTLSKSDIKKWGKVNYNINLQFIQGTKEFEIIGEFEATLKSK